MSEIKELPKGWTNAILEDLLDYIQPTDYIVETTNYNDSYKTPVLTAGKSFILGHTNETEGIFNNLPTIIFDDFTTAIKWVNFPFKVKSSAMKILVATHSEVNMNFVYYFMETLRMNVDTHKRYWISVGAKQNIPLPPIAEQHRIVAKIEELFSSLDRGIESIKTAQAQLKVYRQAVLKWAFEGRLTNKNVKDGELPKKWKWKSIGDVTKKLDQGWSPKCENGSSKNINEWAVIKTTAIQHGKFWDNENKILPVSLVPRTQHELVENDILITRAGPRIRVGVCCLVKNVRPKLLNCDKAYRIKPDLVKVEPSYLVQVLNTQRFLNIIDKCKSGGSDSGLNLTQNVFLSIEVPFPPTLSEQTLIVQEIESRLSVCDKIEESITNSLLQAQALRQSILKKAFEGKLVAQDPNDEPASVLLQRIKAEKEKNEPVKKVKEKKVRLKKVKLVNG